MSEASIRALLSLVEAGLTEKCRPRFDGSQFETADWDFILRTARKHRFSGLVYESARRAKLESLPPTRVWSSLYSDYYTNLARNVVLLDHCESLIEAAHRSNIPVLLLKGAAFVGWLYGGSGLRPMADLDVLIHERDTSAAIKLAEKLDYTLYQTTDHAISLRHSKSGTHLEIHTSLTSCPWYLGLDPGAMFTRSRSTGHGAPPARTLSPEDHLLHLCLHGSFQHGLRQPGINACDVYLLAQLPALDWDRFLDQASKPRLTPLVFAGLGISHRVLPNAKVQSALEALESRVPGRLRRWVKNLKISSLISASEDSVNGSPWNRIAWTPSLKDAYQLISETLQPRGISAVNRNSVLRRGLYLVRRHALARWNRSLWRTGIGARGRA